MARGGMMRVMRRWMRWPAAALSGVFLLAYAANVPFYAGSGLGSYAAWRMEHGRLRVTMQPSPRRESFWLAANAEGLRFRPEWRLSALDDWMVNVPLWAPLLVTAGVAVRGFTAPRYGAGRCSKCGYEVGDQERCPECGKRL